MSYSLYRSVTVLSYTNQPRWLNEYQVCVKFDKLFWGRLIFKSRQCLLSTLLVPPLGDRKWFTICTCMLCAYIACLKAQRFCHCVFVSLQLSFEEEFATVWWNSSQANSLHLRKRQLMEERNWRWYRPSLFPYFQVCTCLLIHTCTSTDHAKYINHWTR